MGRAPRFVATLLTAALAVAVPIHVVSGQTPAPAGASRHLTLPGGQTAGLTGDYWYAALSNGGMMPEAERLLVIARNGLVLAEVEGTHQAVVVPDAVYEALVAGEIRATLVHNHLRGVSLSRADLCLLGKPGVERVIAVGPDASVFEASAGPAYNAATFERSQYPTALRQVTDRLVEESLQVSVDPHQLAPLLSHLVASVLARSGVIHYRMTPGAELKRTLDERRVIVTRVVQAKYRFHP
jgi:hypothetical protein